MGGNSPLEIISVNNIYALHAKQLLKLYLHGSYHKPSDFILLQQFTPHITFFADKEMTVLKNVRHS